MAQYDKKKYYGSMPYGRTEPGYGSSHPDQVHHPVIVDADGRQHEIIGFAEYHNAQKYVAQTEQVVEFRRGGGGGGGLGLAGYNLSPRSKDMYKHQGPGNKPLLVPWRTTPDWPEGGHESPPNHGVHERAKGGSRPYSAYKDNRPPYGHKPRDRGKYNNYSSDDGKESGSESDHENEDVICDNGVCYPNTKGRAQPRNHFDNDGYNSKPKSEVSYYAPHSSYAVPASTPPSTDPYYEKSNTHYKEKPKGRHNYTPAVTAQPRNDPSYPSTHNRPFSSTPPPVKTKLDHTSRNPEYPRKSANNSPVYPAANQPKYNGSPRKETIDSLEAKRRYGGVTVPTEKHAEQKYQGTIDCRAAAEKYNGIFVPGNNF